MQHRSSGLPKGQFPPGRPAGSVGGVPGGAETNFPIMWTHNELGQPIRFPEFVSPGQRTARGKRTTGAAQLLQSGIEGGSLYRQRPAQVHQVDEVMRPLLFVELVKRFLEPSGEI